MGEPATANGRCESTSLTVVRQIVLTANNSIISVEYATGYVTKTWDDRMHILINITSCGTVIGQAWTKTAFAVTLLKLTKGYQQWGLWFCMGTMNLWALFRCIFQWAKVCNKPSYDVWYRLNFCIGWTFRDNFKEGGNGEFAHIYYYSSPSTDRRQFTTSSWTLSSQCSRGSSRGTWTCGRQKRSVSA